MEAKNPNTGKFRVFFERAQATAKQAFSNPEKLNHLLNSAREKILKLRHDNKEFDQVIMKLGTTIRMIRAYKNKSYTQVPWKSILMLTAGLVYFIMPFDLVPDFLPALGILDDASILLWIFATLRKDIEKFEAWEESNLT